NSQKLSLFRLPYSTVYDNGYNNLTNYNWKHFKAISVVSTNSPVSLNGLMPKKLVYNWPNPVKGDITHIRYYVTEPASVNISIYDQAGFKVWEKTETAMADMDNEIIWNVSNVSSGVYFARVNASYGGKEEMKIIKIAVIK
ncbi:MAG: T9SS type A sorting domain-containing protein, partial [Calditrichia bacterium]|nr:T9SS type A sorting domain-containing protein [Calditrichia bacterium]